MKKFLLSLCMLAVASVCVFMTSCKDEDEEAVVEVTGTVDQVIEQQKAEGVTYVFEVDGQPYNSWEEAAAAISAMPAGSAHTIVVIMTKDGQEYRGNATSFVIPTAGQSATYDIDIPVSDSAHSTGIQFTLTTPATHSGGAVI